MKLAYTHENRFLVSNARNILENENIETLLKNEFIGGAAGDLSSFDSWQEIWVEEKDYSKAKKLLSVLTDNDVFIDWICSTCGEANDTSFEICWKCHRERV